MPSNAPVLLVGGSGVVGSQVARSLRANHPSLPLAIGGRDLEKARALAEQLGHAHPVPVDVASGRPSVPPGDYSALVMLVKDERHAFLQAALRREIPYLDISTFAFEIAPEVSFYAHRPKAAPIVLAGMWLAGAASLATLALARPFSRIDAIAIAAVLDEQDVGGAAAHRDYERYLAVGKNAQLVENGRFAWAEALAAGRRFRAAADIEHQGQLYSTLDTHALWAATGAPNVRFDIDVGVSASRTRGEAFSTEVIIELEGLTSDGQKARARHELVHPRGQVPMTAATVTSIVERLVTGQVGPGLHFPQTLVEPARALERLREFGTQVRSEFTVEG